MAQVFKGTAPFNDRTELTTLKEPRQGYPIPAAPERPEEFAPGLDNELQELADALSVFKEGMLNPNKTTVVSKGTKKKEE